jgi:hypothetical protein
MFIIWCCEFESRSGRGVQHYVIKIVSDVRHVGGFSPGPAGDNAYTLHIFLIYSINMTTHLHTFSDISINHILTW